MKNRGGLLVSLVGFGMLMLFLFLNMFCGITPPRPQTERTVAEPVEDVINRNNKRDDLRGSDTQRPIGVPQFDTPPGAN